MDIELRGITKRFGEVVANSNVNLQIRAGEILGLLGENGAGKTTLMNILSGLYRPDEGEILVDGKPTYFESARDAIHAGIGMVHQHFMLVPVFTVAENVVLGVEPTGALDRLDLPKAREQVSAISAAHGLHVDPDAIIEEIPVGTQQRVEILKVLFRSADVLIFDEPTAVLTPQEVTDFFGIVRSLRDAGKALVFITHKLREVLEVSDRISVLRGGRVVGEGDPKTATEADLAEMMVGRQVRFEVEKRHAPPGEPLLVAKGLKALNERDEMALDGVDLTVRAGEIVGVAGVQGNGQTELVEALTGLRPLAGGTVSFLGEDITKASTRERHRRGIAHIPEDRQRSGIVGTFTVAENAVLDSYYDDRFSRGISMHWNDVYAATAKIVTDFRRPHLLDLRDRRPPLRRQPAEARRGARAVARREAGHRLAADARRRRRLDRIHPRAHGRGARFRRRGAHRVDRARRDHVGLRPHPGDVPRQGGGGVRRRQGRRQGDRPGDGGSRGMSDEAAADKLANALLKRAVSTRSDMGEVVLVPILAVLMALILGAITMIATGVSFSAIGKSYIALFDGSLGSLSAFSETLTAAAPLTLAGLGIALAFRAGLFNIGAEGQLILGGMAAVVVGFAFKGLPAFVHLPLALLAGALAGALWASIAGWLRAATGAHEVITTIMLNLIALRLTDYLLKSPLVQKAGRSDPISESVLPSAMLPRLCRSIRTSAYTPASSSWCWRSSSSGGCSSAPRSASSSAPPAPIPTPRAMPACAPG